MLNERKIIGKKIKKARMNLNLTQDKLAQLTGISYGAISKYESGYRKPKPENIDKLEDILGVKLNALTDDSIYVEDVKDNFQLENKIVMVQAIKDYIDCINPEINTENLKLDDETIDIVLSLYLRLSNLK